MKESSNRKLKKREMRIKSQDLEVGPELDEVWSTDGASYAL